LTECFPITSDQETSGHASVVLKNTSHRLEGFIAPISGEGQRKARDSILKIVSVYAGGAIVISLPIRRFTKIGF